jgi:hypothetical protein
MFQTAAGVLLIIKGVSGVVDDHECVGKQVVVNTDVLPEHGCAKKHASRLNEHKEY